MIEGAPGARAAQARRSRRRAFQWTVVGLAALAVLWFGYSLSNVFNPFLLGLLLAYILNPLVEVLERRGVSRTKAVTLLFGVVLLVVAVVVTYATFKATERMVALGKRLVGERVLDPLDPDDKQLIDAYLRLDALREKIERRKATKLTKAELAARRALLAKDPARLSHVIEVGSRPIRIARNGDEFYLDLNADSQRKEGLIEQVTDAVAGRLGAVSLGRDELKKIARNLQGHASALTKVGVQFGQGMKKSLQQLSVFFAYLFLVPLYTFFLLTSFTDLRETIRAHLPAEYRDRIVTIAAKIDRQVAAFFRGKLMLAVLKGVVTTIGLWIAGVPFAFFIGMGAGLLSVVPFIGPLLGVPLAIFLAYGVGADNFALRIVGVLVSFGAAEVVEAVSQPVILGAEVGMSPILLILSLFAFGELFGFFGVLLAVPIASIVKTLFEELVLPEIRGLADLDEAAEEAEGPPPAVPSFANRGQPAPG